MTRTEAVKKIYAFLLAMNDDYSLDERADRILTFMEKELKMKPPIVSHYHGNGDLEYRSDPWEKE